MHPLHIALPVLGSVVLYQIIFTAFVYKNPKLYRICHQKGDTFKVQYKYKPKWLNPFFRWWNVKTHNMDEIGSYSFLKTFDSYEKAEAWITEDITYESKERECKRTKNRKWECV